MILKEHIYPAKKYIMIIHDPYHSNNPSFFDGKSSAKASGGLLKTGSLIGNRDVHLESFNISR